MYLQLTVSVSDMYGISDHDLMFSKDAVNVSDDEEEGPDQGTDYIQSRVGSYPEQGRLAFRAG